MTNDKFHNNSFLFAIVFIISLYSSNLMAADVAQEETLSAPDWTFGILALKQFGGSIDKVAAYANEVVANSGELTRQAIMSALFKLPIKEGLSADGPALIFLLDPITNSETALLLPVTDAKAIKTALMETLGAPIEKDNVLVFTLPQPLPHPDKTMLIKIDQDKLLAAPNAVVLKNLESFIARTSLQQLANALRSDAMLTLKIDHFKRRFGVLLALGLECGALMATQNPQHGPKLQSLFKNMLDTLWQIDVVEAHLTIADKTKSAALEFIIRPVVKTTLANAFQKSADVSDKTARLFSPMVTTTIHITPLTKLALLATAQITDAEVEKLTAELPNLPINLSLSISANAASLRLDLPSAAPRTLLTLWMQMKRARTFIQELFETITTDYGKKN